MIKLKDIIKEIDDTQSIDLDRLYYNSVYRDEISQKLGYKYDFNKSFWNHPQKLFHCTPNDHLESIQQHGLLCKNETRGINNTSIGSAIFTTREFEEIDGLKNSYGPVVIIIDTISMKRDGFTPIVEEEPEVEEAKELTFIFNKIGKDAEIYQFIDSSGGISEYTVIVYDDIPPKYLKVLND